MSNVGVGRNQRERACRDLVNRRRGGRRGNTDEIVELASRAVPINLHAKPCARRSCGQRPHLAVLARRALVDTLDFNRRLAICLSDLGFGAPEGVSGTFLDVLACVRVQARREARSL